MTCFSIIDFAIDAQIQFKQESWFKFNLKKKKKINLARFNWQFYDANKEES